MKGKVEDYFRVVLNDFELPDKIGDYNYRRLLIENIEFLKLDLAIGLQYCINASLSKTFGINRNMLKAYHSEEKDEISIIEVDEGVKEKIYFDKAIEGEENEKKIRKIYLKEDNSIGYLEEKVDENGKKIMYIYLNEGNNEREHSDKNSEIKKVTYNRIPVSFLCEESEENEEKLITLYLNGKDDKNGEKALIAYLKEEIEEDGEKSYVVYKEIDKGRKLETYFFNNSKQSRKKIELLDSVVNCITDISEIVPQVRICRETIKQQETVARNLDEFLQAIWEQILLDDLCECDIYLEVLNKRRYDAAEKRYVSVYAPKWDDDLKKQYANARTKFKNRNKDYWAVKLEETTVRKQGNSALMKNFAVNTIRAFVLTPGFKNLYNGNVENNSKYAWDKMNNLKTLCNELKLDFGVDDIWLYEKLTGCNTSVETFMLADFLLQGRSVKVEGDLKESLGDFVKEVMKWPGSYSRKKVVDIFIYLAKSIKDEVGELDEIIFLQYCINFLKSKMPILIKKYDNALALMKQFFKEQEVETFDSLDVYYEKFLNENRIGFAGIGCICNSQEKIFLRSVDDRKQSFLINDKVNEIVGGSLCITDDNLLFQYIQKEVIMNR